ncbi:hypothetical protein BB559_001340 [Furculomyces boomerangus]|uniref:aspartyl aminopeptidase n=2 Tax=Furculomyces boomerangus TaxID=61424 RepID=A0A2T9Z298_9FUNG|nr:hypothetical protein BB559_001340 [Furculomyces boomerangus]
MRIPSLAIHLDRTANEAFKFNNETHLTPMLATVAKVCNHGEKSLEKDSATISSNTNSQMKHHPILLQKIAKNLGVEVSQIRDFELCLYDTQLSVIGGICDEFIFSPRLDNLNSSFCSVEGFIDSLQESKSLDNDTNVWMVALFDNEEIGSKSAYGADSTLLDSTLKRLQIGGNLTSFEQTVANSFLVSADMAHAVHPNYFEKHEDNHAPQMNQGLVIKVNANQRYATTSATSAILKVIAEKHDLPLQEFVVRNDSPCGSTIGPLISANLGIRTIDVGNPMLAMHSIRETMGSDDVHTSIEIFKAFFKEFSEVDSKFIVD